MRRFPKPIHLPQNVHDSRKKRNKDVLGGVRIGIYFRLFVIIFEFIGVILIQSSTLLVDVISSFADVISSLFLAFCMKLAQRPPDHDHPFGHGRYEPIGGIAVGILLIALGIVMLVQQLLGIYQESVVHYIHPWAWLFPATAVICLEVAYRLLMRVSKREHSPALAADAVHYRIDSLTSLVAMIALIMAGTWPNWSSTVDHIGAMVIALFMIGMGFYASRSNFNQLMDKVPNPKYFEVVKTSALNTSGVEGTEKIRIQQYGPDAHVDIDIEVNPSLTVARAHKISQQVRVEIQKAWPAVRDVTVHIEPYYSNDH